jgi:apolipoprotein N-acyltransferase
MEHQAIIAKGSECARLRWRPAVVGLESCAGSRKLRALKVTGFIKTDPARQLGAVLLGGLLALAFPLANIAGFAWIAPGGLVLLAARGDGREAFQTGSLFGLALALTALYWLNYMPVDGLPVLAWMALGGYLAAWYGAWAWFVRRTLPVSFGDLNTLSWWRRTRWMLVAAAAWTTMEFAVGWLLTGLPWLRLGVTQGGLSPLLQMTAWVGVPGLSFLMVWFSLALVTALLLLAGAPDRRWLAWREISLPMLVVAVVFAVGTQRIKAVRQAVDRDAREVRVGLVQPSFPQTLIWDAGAATNRFRKTLALSRIALAAKPDVLIWPESGLPGLLRFDQAVYREVTGLAREQGVWLVCNGDDAELPDGATDVSRPDFFNAAFLISPDGQLIDRYHKRQLVMFGEYVPLVKWLPFLKYLTPIGEGFSAGQKAARFELRGLGITASPLICFEDVFPWLARDAAGAETDVLVNLTNDGWFGESAEQWQHLANARCRAIETGRPLIRCANNGISCWIDPTGQIHGVRFDDDRSVYAAGVKVLPVKIPATRITTPYGRRGDWFAWLCVAATLLGGRGSRRRPITASS